MFGARPLGRDSVQREVDHMSVLNTMLRDLESRGAAAEAAAQAVLEPSVPAAPMVRPLLPPPQESRAARLLRIAAWGGVALIVAATGVGYAWYAHHLNELARAPQPIGLQQFGAAVEASTALVATSAAEPPATLNEAAAPSGAAKPVASMAAPPGPDARKTKTAAAPPPAQDRPRIDARKTAPTQASPRLDESAATAETQSPPRASAATPTDRSPAASPASGAEDIVVSRPSNPGAALEARASELIARGRSVEAMALLAQLLQQSPANGTARATLAALQAEAGRRDLAVQTLLAGSHIEPVRFATAAARLQAELGEPAAALATLERVPEEARNAAHDALIGGLAQRAGEHKRAVDAFQRALRTPKAPAVWWAGLAVSLEALDQPAAALAAFRQAVADPSLPAATRGFALNRISALTQSSHARGFDGTVLSARP
jgi:Flp pilus assembly protein TadD